MMLWVFGIKKAALAQTITKIKYNYGAGSLFALTKVFVIGWRPGAKVTSNEIYKSFRTV
jgi:hypothetical protein